MPSSGYPGLTTPPNPPPAPPTDLRGVVAWLGNFAMWFQGVNRWMFAIYTVVNNILLGKINSNINLTLTASASSTTITDPRLTGDSAIMFTPTTLNAANALTTMRITSRTKGSATVTHALDAATDKTFRVCIIG